jgi:hypothetical protein
MITRNKNFNAFQVIDNQTGFVLFTFSTEATAMNKMFRCKGDVTVESVKVDSNTFFGLVATENKSKKLSK